MFNNTAIFKSSDQEKIFFYFIKVVKMTTMIALRTHDREAQEHNEKCSLNKEIICDGSNMPRCKQRYVLSLD